MKIQVKFFVPLNIQVGTNQLEIELPDGATGRDLLRYLADRFSENQSVRRRFLGGRVLFLVGKEFISLDSPLQDQMTLVILPQGSCCHP